MGNQKSSGASHAPTDRRHPAPRGGVRGRAGDGARAGRGRGRRGRAGFPLFGSAAVVRPRHRSFVSPRAGFRDGRSCNGFSEAGAQLGPRAKVSQHLSARRVLQLAPRAAIQPGGREGVLRVAARRSRRAGASRSRRPEETAALAGRQTPLPGDERGVSGLRAGAVPEVEDRPRLSDTYVWVENRER